MGWTRMEWAGPHFTYVWMNDNEETGLSLINDIVRSSALAGASSSSHGLVEAPTVLPCAEVVDSQRGWLLPMSSLWQHSSSCPCRSLAHGDNSGSFPSGGTTTSSLVEAGRLLPSRWHIGSSWGSSLWQGVEVRCFMEKMRCGQKKKKLPSIGDGSTARFDQKKRKMRKF